MGRFSGIGVGLSVIADKLRKERELGAETGQKINLLGVEGLMKGTIEPAEEEETGTTFNLPMGKFKPVEQIKAVINPATGQVEYTIPKKSVFKPKETPDITKTTALNIISDPIKAEQLKMTYPDVYSLIEGIAQGDTKTTQPFQLPRTTPEEKRINVISSNGQKGTIPESQLQDALKSGYKRLP